MLNIKNTTLEVNEKSLNRNVKKEVGLDFLSIFDTTDNEEDLLDVMTIIQNINIEQHNIKSYENIIKNNDLNINDEVNLKKDIFTNYDTVQAEKGQTLESIYNLMKFKNEEIKVENLYLDMIKNDNFSDKTELKKSLNFIAKNVNKKDEILKNTELIEGNIQNKLPSIKIETLNLKNNFKLHSQQSREISLLKEIADDENISLVQIMNNDSLKINSNDLEIETKPIAVRKEYITKDIVKAISYLKSNDIQNLKVNITPKNLGELTINLIKSSEDTKVLIAISEQESFNLINKNLKEITQHLESTNIKVSQIVVEVKMDSQSLFGDSLSQQFNDRSNQNQSSKQNKNEKKDLEQEKSIANKDENISILA